MINDLIMINGEWYVIVEIDGDSVWASNEDGEEFEFPIDVLED